MTKFVGIVSAKGGVGKTTSCINLAAALDWFRRDVILIDCNFANPDIGIHLGTPFREKTIHSALRGKHHINESIYKHPSGIKIIPGHISYEECKKTQRQNLLNIILDLADTSEVVIIDSTPGLGNDSKSVLKAVDYVIIVTTPDMCSVSNSIKMVKFAEEHGKEVLGVIVNRTMGEYIELPTSNIETLIGKKVVAVIPEDPNIRLSMHQKNPVIATHPQSPSSIGYKKLAAMLIGDRYVESIEKEEKTSKFRQAMKRMGF